MYSRTGKSTHKWSVREFEVDDISVFLIPAMKYFRYDENSITMLDDVCNMAQPRTHLDNRCGDSQAIRG